tara:strand:- start:69 stop:293 length:225 start_codon:yes stop_codon:yes gene_type:complete
MLLLLKSKICFNLIMSSSLNHDIRARTNNSEGKVTVTDLLTRLKEEKKIENKRNLALGVAAVSAVTVFGIILTI